MATVLIRTVETCSHITTASIPVLSSYRPDALPTPSQQKNVKNINTNTCIFIMSEGLTATSDVSANPKNVIEISCLSYCF